MGGALNTELHEVIQRLAKLDAWDSALAHNWVLVSKRLDVPVFVCVIKDANAAIHARLILFIGVRAFLTWQNSAAKFKFTHAMPSALDYRHWEVIFLANGTFSIQSFWPGLLMQDPNAEESVVLVSLLKECEGLLMRFEETPDLPLHYLKTKDAMFSRVEGLDGKWRDAPYSIRGKAIAPDCISLNNKDCAAAITLPISKGETWDIDFVAIPNIVTMDHPPRILFVFAAVEEASGAFVFRNNLSIPLPKGGYHISDDTGLEIKKLQNALAQLLLNQILKLKKFPERICVRTPRMADMLRPLGFHVPFKLSQQSGLPQFDAAFQALLRGGKIVG